MANMRLRVEASKFFSKNKFVKCPAFPKEKISFNSKGLSHLFYKGSQKVFARTHEESKVRVSLLPRALKILSIMPLAQEENIFKVHDKKIKYWAFEAVVDERRIKVVVRQIGNGKKHFWSVIPAWRRARGMVINARGSLSKE